MLSTSTIKTNKTERSKVKDVFQVSDN